MQSEPTIQDLFSLSGKTALISGGSGWLGGAMARGLAEAGARVIVSSRDAGRATAAAAALPPVATGSHGGVVIDHLVPASIEAGFDEAVKQAGQIDILVNNAHAGDAHDWSNASAEDFNAVLANASGWFLLARRLREHVVARGATGSVINIGSMYGQVASYPDAYADLVPASPVSYHTLKGGILHMTRHLAVYWAADRVRVNCLSPAPFPGPSANRGMVARLEKKSPMGRMGSPHELKGALVFLASEASSYVTGQNLTVDGGWTAW